ncbi:hypothetical protein [Mycolicibacterium rhodesiae]|uniref:DUF4352 domain-containing protein n=1 Tax=Mycolicibacterium rhodesiae TaxID=36814 RepID=A0A1X0IK67_MYCRH|nr:hypothetical protein [Mycolicibacterium rhodesiae]MCV7342882.1 hypothetical protein [Mycolicibacterium rhodesiae]ORB48312.1 hypothetical protein BST42_25860 [Mycolicibacterium rhodesiae]
MGEAPDTAATPRRGVRGWFAGLSLSQIGQLLTVVILAGTALFGGLDTVDSAVTEFTPGKEFSDNAFTVTLERATLVDELRAGTTLIAPKTPGRTYLGIVMKIRNDGTVPAYLDDEIDLRDQPDKRFYGVVRVTDGSPVPSLGPGLTEEVGVLWTLPHNALHPGDSVTVRIWKKKFTELMVTYGRTWVDSETEYGQATLPVRGKQ